MISPVHISTQLTYLRVRGIFGHFLKASKRYGVPVSLLIAIASRESGAGLNLDENYTGDNGNGIGIMQIDKRYHPEFVSANENSDHEANIDYGARFLSGLIDRFNGNITQAVSAYNAGEGNVRRAMGTALHPDRFTTGGNYSTDVLARKKMIESLLGISKVSSVAVFGLPVAVTGFLFYKFLTHNNYSYV